MNNPELRCLICDRVLSDDSDPTRPGEKCGQCGKTTVPADPVTVLPIRSVEVSTVLPATPPPIPDAFPKARVVPQGIPALNRFVSPPLRTAEIPEADPPTPKLAFALFVAFLTLLAIMASLTVIGYAIVTGLKKAAKRVDGVPTIRATMPPSTRN